MPDIEVSDDQYTFLEDLMDALAEEHVVGAYGAVRPRDALQFLIDHYEGDVESLDESAENGAEDEEDEDDKEGSDPPEDPTDRLNAMMQLLETHDDKWEESDSENARYVVHLPDDGEEHVQTKDDVRAVLFKHYG
ncbi:MAG: hypothetical protein R3324_06185 [Halobacteriales archaeon]|nr:hypothetical protein [Halobacteriales archaeon]